MLPADDIRHPDYQGPNPFAEAPADARQIPSGESPYAAPGQSNEYLPYDFAPILVPRSRTVFWLGTCGLAAIFVAGSLIAAWTARGESGGDPVAEIMAVIFGLTFAVPAWLLGRSDRRAIRDGAMRGQETVRLAWGTATGMGATWLGIGMLLVVLLRVILA